MEKIDTAAYLLPTDMVFIKGGTFEMGDVFNDNEFDTEKPVHLVTVGDFYMSACCVTFKDYVMYCFLSGAHVPDDWGWGRGKRPVMYVTWYEAIEYCNFLSMLHLLEPVYTIDKTRQDPNNNHDWDRLKWIVTPNWSANGYRLPTEAEWEYAAREGGRGCCFGNGQNTLRPTEANFDASASYKQSYSKVGKYRGKTVPVDSFAPNALGLYNMSGNVWEWCWDWYNSGYYQISPAVNPRGPASGSGRVLRGGSWYYGAVGCRVADRDYSTPSHRNNHYGFRIVLLP